MSAGREFRVGTKPPGKVNAATSEKTNATPNTRAGCGPAGVDSLRPASRFQSL